MSLQMIEATETQRPALSEDIRGAGIVQPFTAS